MKCPKCNFENPENNKFCINCGAPLPKTPASEASDQISDTKSSPFQGNHSEAQSQPSPSKQQMTPPGQTMPKPHAQFNHTQSGDPSTPVRIGVPYNQQIPKFQQAPNYQQAPGYQQRSNYQQAPNYQQPQNYQQAPNYQQPQNYQPSNNYPLGFNNPQSIPQGQSGAPNTGYGAAGMPPQINYQGQGAGQNKQPKKKAKAGLWIGLSAGLLVIIALVLLLFPRRIEYDSQDNPTTYEKTLSRYTVHVKCNQGVKEVFYAVNPENPANTDSYLPAATDGSFFKKNINFSNLPLESGNNTLYLTTKTLFGKSKPEKIILTRIDTYASRVQEESKQSLDQNTALAGNELILVLKIGTERSAVDDLARKYDAEVVGAIPLVDEYQLRFNDGGVDLEQMRSDILGEELVENVLYNFVYTLDDYSVPQDPLYDSWDSENPEGNNWQQEAMRVPQAYAENYDMQRVKAGIIDGSVQYDHEDLQIPLENVYINPSRMIRNMQDLVRYFGKSTASPGEDYNDLLTHGTHVAGIIGALTDNGVGIAGVNRDVELYFYHFWHFDVDPATNEIIYYEGDPEISTMEFHASVARLVEDGCRVLNLSIGSSYPSRPEDCPWEPGDTDGFANLCARLEQQGYDFLMFKAAGNSTDDASNYSMNRVFTGSAIGKKHTVIVASIVNIPIDPDMFSDTPQPAKAGYELSYFSNYGELVDVAAPGSDIYSTVPYDQYEWLQGTSMASPDAAGVACILYAINPDANCEEIKNALMTQTDTYTLDIDDRAIPVVNAALAAETVDNNINRRDTLVANVLDADTKEPITEFQVLADCSGGLYAFSYRYGKFGLIVPPDSYSLTFSANGYGDVTYDQITTIGENKTIELPDVLMQKGGSNRPGEGSEITVSGSSLDAVSGDGLGNVTLTIYTGTDTSAAPLTTLTTNEQGNYEVRLTSGSSYTVVGTKEEYIENQIVIDATETTEDMENQNIVMSPNITSEQTRFVLSWGETPYDLDLHIKGPGVGNDEYGHVYWWDSEYYNENGEVMYNLDTDDTNSYGPETITIEKETPGAEYIIYVHDYSNRGYDSSNELGASGAKITVYTKTGTQVFDVPNSGGTLWKVLKYKDGVITPINEMLYEIYDNDVAKH